MSLLRKDGEIDRKLIVCLEGIPLLSGGRLVLEPQLFSFFLPMTQMKLGASQIGGRLFKSAATSALALSALAGGVMLSGGEAKALTCNFDSSISQQFSITGCSDGTTNPDPPLDGGSVYNNTWHDTNPIPTDKQIKFISGPTGGKGDIEWKWVDRPPAGKSYLTDEWHVDVDFNPDFDSPSIAANTSIFKYIVKIVDDPLTPENELAKLTFENVALDAIFGAADPTYTGTSTVQKDIYTVLTGDSQGTLIGSIICSANPTLGMETCGPSVNVQPYKELYIVDTANFAANGRYIDAYQNAYTQVPGPLPILGAGAAFGFSRKLRGRIKASRTA